MGFVVVFRVKKTDDALCLTKGERDRERKGRRKNGTRREGTV